MLDKKHIYLTYAYAFCNSLWVRLWIENWWNSIHICIKHILHLFIDRHFMLFKCVYWIHLANINSFIEKKRLDYQFSYSICIYTKFKMEYIRLVIVFFLSPSLFYLQFNPSISHPLPFRQYTYMEDLVVVFSEWLCSINGRWRRRREKHASISCL